MPRISAAAPGQVGTSAPSAAYLRITCNPRGCEFDVVDLVRVVLVQREHQILELRLALLVTFSEASRSQDL